LKRQGFEIWLFAQERGGERLWVAQVHTVSTIGAPSRRRICFLLVKNPALTHQIPTNHELQGISFQIGEDRFKGSQIDQQFSLGNLLKTLATQRKRQKVKPALSLQDRKKALLIRPKSSLSSAPTPTPQQKQVLSPSLLALLKPVETRGGGIP
jgi:hypothetical protein